MVRGTEATAAPNYSQLDAGQLRGADVSARDVQAGGAAGSNMGRRRRRIIQMQTEVPG